MNAPKNKVIIKVPFRPRGSGIKVTIIHEDDERAEYFVRNNAAAGNKMLRDAKGWIYTMACQYELAVTR